MKERENSSGALVPAVKPLSVLAPESAIAGDEIEVSPTETDKDLMCPICMQMIKDAFLTACGHSFCYMCIITHLRNKSDCPCCGRHLTNNQLYPNFLLDKLLKKASVRQVSRNASPVEQFRRALLQSGL